ncbi:hypothetical protein I79_010533 [Cricetulus griseus]|uniref:Uncharacterized protein n=1 Tax=Cricetulus griseus TaxID=10029 RepID=G3HIQ7_CRIGR|nr:hypothetical protein I79_010533 [Cricetulus griseus]
MDVHARSDSCLILLIHSGHDKPGQVLAGPKQTEPWEAEGCAFLDRPPSLSSVYVYTRMWLVGNGVPASKETDGNKML